MEEEAWTTAPAAIRQVRATLFGLDSAIAPLPLFAERDSVADAQDNTGYVLSGMAPRVVAMMSADRVKPTNKTRYPCTYDEEIFLPLPWQQGPAVFYFHQAFGPAHPEMRPCRWG